MTALELDDDLGNAASNLVLALLQDGQTHRAETAARLYRVPPEAFETLQTAVERRAAPMPTPEDPALEMEIDDETT